MIQKNDCQKDRALKMSRWAECDSHSCINSENQGLSTVTTARKMLCQSLQGVCVFITFFFQISILWN